MDASYIARVSVGLDTGFDAFDLTDPVVIGDVTGNGTLSGMDASYVARKSVYLPQPKIPDLPGTLPPFGSQAAPIRSSASPMPMALRTAR